MTIRSPLRSLVVVAGSVFAVELLVMLLLPVLPPMPPLVTALLDSASLLALLLPVLFAFVFRPLNLHIGELEQAQAELRRAHDELEKRVQERTAELHTANAELRAEVTERRRVAEALRQAHDELELRVEARTRELATLNTIGAVTSGSRDLSELIAVLKPLLAEPMNAAAGAVSLYEEATDQLRVVSAWGLPEALVAALRETRATDFHSEDVVRRHEAALAWPWLSPAQLAALGQSRSPLGRRSCLSIPLTAGGRLQGVLDLFSDSPDGFGGSYMGFVAALGHEIGVAIHRARLHETESRARETAEGLCAASLALTQSLDLDAVLTALLDYAGQMAPYDSAAVLLLEDGGRLEMRASHGYARSGDPEAPGALTLDAMPGSHLEATLAARCCVVIADTRRDTRWRPLPGTGHVLNWLGVPLVTGGRVIGLLGLDKAQPDFFTDEHVQVAQVLSAQAAASIQNARLFAQLSAQHQNGSRADAGAGGA
jgi:GAF domain-containing protein